MRRAGNCSLRREHLTDLQVRGKFSTGAFARLNYSGRLITKSRTVRHLMVLQLTNCQKTKKTMYHAFTC